MSTKTTIFNELISYIQNYYTISKGYKFIDNINSFPYITINSSDENFYHISTNIRYSSFLIYIRVYIKSSTSMNDADDIAEHLDSLITNYTSPNIVEARIESITTDEGLLEPNAIVDMTARLIYQHDTRL